MSDYTIEAPDGSEIEARPADSPILAKIRRLEGSGDSATSPKGAIGRFQITPDTAKTYGIDTKRLSNADYNERSAARIVDDLEKKFPGDEDAVLVAYNAGPGRARQWIKNGRKDSDLPAETRKYLDHGATLGRAYGQAGDYTIEGPDGQPIGGAPKSAASARQAQFDARKAQAQAARASAFAGGKQNASVSPRGNWLERQKENIITDVERETRGPRAELAKDLKNPANLALGMLSPGAGKTVMDLADTGFGAVSGLAQATLGSVLYPHRGSVTSSDDAYRKKFGDLAASAVPVGGEEATATKEARALADKGAAMLKGRVERVTAAAETKAPLAAPKTREEAYARHVDNLKKEGVIVTPGQEKGGEAARNESARMSNPLWSKATREAEDRSINTFNVAAYNRVLKPLGVKVKADVLPGRDAVGGVESIASSAYEAIKPGIKATFDAPVTEAIKKSVDDAAEHGADNQAALEAFIKNRITPKLKDGVLDGQGYIDVKSALASKIRGLKGDPSLHVRESAERYQDILDAVMDSAERYSAPGVKEKLRKADTAWAMLTRIQEASTRRLNGQGQFSPHDLLAAVRHQSPSVGGRRPAFARGDALLQDLADSGVAVLPNRVPASDTAEKGLRNGRGAIGAGVGALVGGPAGAVAGFAADRAAPLATNRIAKAMLDSHAARQAQRSVSRAPKNYLARVSRATSPLVAHRKVGPAIGGLNAIAALSQDADQ